MNCNFRQIQYKYYFKVTESISSMMLSSDQILVQGLDPVQKTRTCLEKGIENS